MKNIRNSFHYFYDTVISNFQFVDSFKRSCFYLTATIAW